MVSIIIPVYNVAPYLCECLDSLLVQDYVNWEAVCVDDGSTDNSGLILDEYAERDSRIKVIHQSNRGVGPARNVGLDHAIGDWILFLDGDDVFSSDVISMLSRVATQFPHADMVSFESVRFRNQLKMDRLCREEIREVDTSRVIGMRDCYWGLCKKAFSAKVVRGKRFPLYAHGEDLIFLADCLRDSSSLVKSSYAYHGYRCREGSATMTHQAKYNFDEMLGVSIALLSIYDSSGKGSREFFSERIKLLLQRYVWNLLFLPKGEQEFYWGKLIRGLRGLHLGKNVPPWARFVVWAYIVSDSKICACLLSILPYWIGRCCRKGCKILRKGLCTKGCWR